MTTLLREGNFKRRLARAIIANKLDAAEVAKELGLEPAKVQEWLRRQEMARERVMPADRARKTIDLFKAIVERDAAKLKVRRLRRTLNSGGNMGRKKVQVGSASQGKLKRKANRKVDETLKRKIAALAVRGGLRTDAIARKLEIGEERVARWQVKFGREFAGKKWPTEKTAAMIQRLKKDSVRD
jgi:transposase-like protein